MLFKIKHVLSEIDLSGECGVPGGCGLRKKKNKELEIEADIASKMMTLEGMSLSEAYAALNPEVASSKRINNYDDDYNEEDDDDLYWM